MMIGYVLLHYDVKLQDELAGRPSNMWPLAFCMPKIGTKVMFKEREAALQPLVGQKSIL